MKMAELSSPPESAFIYVYRTAAYLSPLYDALMACEKCKSPTGAVLQIRRDNMEKSGIITHISP